jgi:multiple sugar transport system substrate-binding protein
MKHNAWRIAMMIVGALSTGVAGVAPGHAAPTVSISIWGGYPEIQPVYKMAADAYAKGHPNVQVTVLTTELRDFERKLAASIPSDTAGDILEFDPTTMNRYIVAGLIPKAPSDIVEFVHKSFAPQDQKTVTVGGAVYGVPWFKGEAALFYNTTMFSEAGLSQPPKNMAEVMADAKKLTKYDAQGRVIRSGLSFRLFGAGSGIAEKFAMWMWPRGGEILTGNGQGKYKAGYDNDAGRATMTMYLDGVYKDKVDSFDIKHDADAFALGQTAMLVRESWVIGYIQKNAPTLKYNTAPFPMEKRWGTLSGPTDIYVSRSSKNPAVAWDFVKFLMQPEYEQALLTVTGWIAERQDISYDPVFAKTPQFKAFLFSNPGYVRWAMPAIKDFDEIETKLATRLEAAYRNRSLAGNPAGIARALHQAAQESNGILKRDGLYGE